MRRRTRRRSGVSLLEAIIALGVLVASAAMLAQLLGIARAHIERADRIRTAQRLCQNTLNEIAIGLLPAEAAQQTAYLRPEGWSYSVAVQPLGGTLAAVCVAVYSPENNRMNNGEGVAPLGMSGRVAEARGLSSSVNLSQPSTASTDSGAMGVGSFPELTDGSTYALVEWIRIRTENSAVDGFSQAASMAVTDRAVPSLQQRGLPAVPLRNASPTNAQRTRGMP